MEWLRQMSLKKSLSIFLLMFLFIGLIAYLIPVLIISFMSPYSCYDCECGSFKFLNIIVPFIIVVIMQLLVVALFYRLKLKKPISQLGMVAQRIKDNDLDFSIDFNSKDELGLLCQSFESMRIELLQSNRKLWHQMEERKYLNAAFAHDLRNPVTVLKGSAEILQNRLEQGDLTTDKASKNIALIRQYTERIENYVEVMTSVQKLAEIAFVPKSVKWSVLLSELDNALSILGASAEKEIKITFDGEDKQICIDKHMIYNVAENLTSNALRYAKSCVSIDVACDHEKVTLCVYDDGYGFSSTILEKGATPFLRDDDTERGQNFGIGLYICRLLCEKHSGGLTLENYMTGAKVTATFYF